MFSKYFRYTKNHESHCDLILESPVLPGKLWYLLENDTLHWINSNIRSENCKGSCKTVIIKPIWLTYHKDWRHSYQKYHFRLTNVGKTRLLSFRENMNVSIRIKWLWKDKNCVVWVKFQFIFGSLLYRYFSCFFFRGNTLP